MIDCVDWLVSSCDKRLLCHSVVRFYGCRFIFEAYSDRLLDPQHWISTLTIELNLEFQYWQFCLMLKKYVNVESIEKFQSVHHWHIFSTLRKIINIEIQNWAQMSMLKFNVKGLKACQNKPLIIKYCYLKVVLPEDKDQVVSIGLFWFYFMPFSYTGV